MPRAPGTGWSAVGRELRERRNLPLWLILILLLASAGVGSATTNFLNMQQVVVNMLGVDASSQLDPSGALSRGDEHLEPPPSLKGSLGRWA